jgi:hypothetical protein
MGTNRSREESIKDMRLLSRKVILDDEGRWWVIEKRHCYKTRLVLKVTRRITE